MQRVGLVLLQASFAAWDFFKRVTTRRDGRLACRVTRSPRPHHNRQTQTRTAYGVMEPTFHFPARREMEGRRPSRRRIGRGPSPRDAVVGIFDRLGPPPGRNEVTLCARQRTNEPRIFPSLRARKHHVTLHIIVSSHCHLLLSLAHFSKSQTQPWARPGHGPSTHAIVDSSSSCSLSILFRRPPRRRNTKLACVGQPPIFLARTPKILKIFSCRR